MAAAVQHLLADNYSEPMAEADKSGTLVVRPFKLNLALRANPLLDTGSDIKLMPLLGVGLPGFLFLGCRIDIPVLETSSTNVVLELGDSTSASAYLTTTLAGTLGQAAGRISYGDGITGTGPIVGCLVLGSLPKTYTIDDYLLLTVQTGPTTETSSITIIGEGYYTQWPIRTF